MPTQFRRLFLLGALLGAGAAQAAAFEDPQALEMRVVAALGAAVGEPGGPLAPIDRRLKLAACPAPTIVDPPAMGAATIRCAPLGWRVRVPLARGATTTTAAAAPIVRKGDQVELTAASGSFSVSTVAVAEQDGAPGDRIRVRSERKTGAVIGIVMADGRVSLPGFN